MLAKTVGFDALLLYIPKNPPFILLHLKGV